MWALFQPPLPSGFHVFSSLSGCEGQIVHFEQIRVFKAGLRLNTWAWNDINRFFLLVYWWWEGRKWERGMVGAIRTAALEVKFLDRCKTNNSESIWQERFHRSRTKVKGSKTIRYRRSLNHKLCRLEIGGCYFMTPSASYEKSKSLGSGGRSEEHTSELPVTL